MSRAEEDTLWAALHKPADRDPRGFIIPSNQSDFLTAIKFVDALLETGITVQRATHEFTVQGKSYPAGSLVVQTAQAFRPLPPPTPTQTPLQRRARRAYAAATTHLPTRSTGPTAPATPSCPMAQF